MLARYLVLTFLIISHLFILLTSVTLSSLFPALMGTLALSCMAFSLLLAARLKWIDKICGGPDKAYQIHRFLGYGALTTTIGHWLSASTGDYSLVPNLAHFAEETGEFSAIFLCLLAFISAIQLTSYRWWKKVHSLMGPLFMICVFHSLFSSLPFAVLSSAWWTVVLISSVGTFGWLITLYNTKKQPVKAEVTCVNKTSNSLDIRLKPAKKLAFKPGQFASISCNDLTPEYHPFSIASSPVDQEIRFIVANSGDYTQQMLNKIKIGSLIDIQKISGSFQPEIKARRKSQIWLAAGTGITPFLSALASLKADQGEKIDFIYCCPKSKNHELMEELQHYQKTLPQLSVRFFDSRDRLTFEKFEAIAATNSTANLYICGSKKLKSEVLSYWTSLTLSGIVNGKFYTEDFDFRSAIPIKSLTQRITNHLNSFPLINKKLIKVN